MSKPPVLACDHWKNNAYLIRDGVARLGYLRRNLLTLDPTYGQGVWWRLWRPHVLFDHDIAMDGHDFREMPYPDGMFPQIAYDPPYVSMGGRATTKIRKFYEQYGLIGAPTSPQKLQALINDGLTEMYRLAAPKGIVIAKTMNYVSSGKLQLSELWTMNHAEQLGFVIEDRFILHGRPRQQPKRTRKDGKKSKQKHARNNASTMFVLRKAA